VRVGVLTQWYEPESGAAAHPTAVAKALAVRGSAVRVLTGFPNYPVGRVYPEYKMRFRVRESRNGIDVLRVPLYPSHDDSALRRATSVGSFAASASIQAGWLRDSDALLVYMSPATAGVPALLQKAIRKTPYVLYIQDLWPDSVFASGFLRSSSVGGVVERSLNALCDTLYRHASAIAVIAPTMRELLIERGVHPAKVHVIYNWVDEETFAPKSACPEALSALSRDCFWLMYAGGMGEVQGLDTAVRALHRLPHRPHIRLAFVGEGVARSELRNLVDRLALQDRVVFLRGRKTTEMPEVMAAADAQLVSLRDLPLFHGTIPSKTQAAMAVGQPIIVSAPGDAGLVVTSAGAGLSVMPESPDALAKAIETMAGLSSAERAEMGRRGREFYAHNLSSRVGADSLNALLRQGAAQSTKGRVAARV
jgi:colanic acid biosynthesis glycosyl transferase WcaI